MPFVQDILAAKGNQTVWSIGPERPVSAALREMSERNIAALLVTEKEHIVGIVSERDFVRRAARGNFDPDTACVAEVMTPRVLYASLEQTAEDCLALMTEKRVRHLPVIREGQLAGLISIGDIVKTLISEKELLIDQLTRYVTGDEYVPRSDNSTEVVPKLHAMQQR